MSDKDQLETLRDESEIRALASRFSDAANRRDKEAFRAIWAADSTWTVLEPFPFHAEGRDSIADKVMEMLGMFDVFFQMTHSGVVTLQGGVARSRWAVQEVVRSKDRKINQNNLAMYDDELVRVDGRWLYARRTYHYVYFDESPLVGRSFSLPATLGAR